MSKMKKRNIAFNCTVTRKFVLRECLTFMTWVETISYIYSVKIALMNLKTPSINERTWLTFSFKYSLWKYFMNNILRILKAAIVKAALKLYVKSFKSICDGNQFFDGILNRSSHGMCSSERGVLLKVLHQFA